MSKNKIIQISGKMGSGKDTIQELIEGYIYTYYESSIEFTNISFATKLKKVAAIMLGVNVHKLSDRDFKNSYLEDWGMTVREFLQKIGTEAIRNGLHNDAWVICYKNDVKENFENADSDLRIVFTTDLRMRNEMDLSRKWFDGNEYELHQIRVNRKLKIRDWLILDGIDSLVDNEKEEFRYEVWDEYITSTDYINLVDLYNFKTPEDRQKFEQVKKARAHFSETDLDDYKPMDFNIENRDNLNELENKVYTICDHIFHEFSDLDN